MTKMKDLFQSADWKTEKHVPVIEVSFTVRQGVNFPITITVGEKSGRTYCLPGGAPRYFGCYSLREAPSFMPGRCSVVPG